MLYKKPSIFRDLFFLCVPCSMWLDARGSLRGFSLGFAAASLQIKLKRLPVYSTDFDFHFDLLTIFGRRARFLCVLIGWSDKMCVHVDVAGSGFTSRCRYWQLAARCGRSFSPMNTASPRHAKNVRVSDPSSRSWFLHHRTRSISLHNSLISQP